MLEQNDIKKIEKIIDDRVTPLEKEIKRIEQVIDKRISPLEEEMGSMKEEMGSMKEEMGSMKKTMEELDIKIDTKFAESMEYTKQLIMSFQGEMNEKLDKLINMNTEDIVAVNDDVISLKDRVSTLEAQVKTLQTKTT